MTEHEDHEPKNWPRLFASARDDVLHRRLATTSSGVTHRAPWGPPTKASIGLPRTWAASGRRGSGMVLRLSREHAARLPSRRVQETSDAVRR